MGLVVRCRPRGRRVPGSKPDSIVDPSCMGPASREVIRRGSYIVRWCGAEVWKGGYQLRCRPRHLISVQNYEVRPKIALALPLNKPLI
ncbi:hypothetical protein AVEN_136210-1 [Araneus ventricosus]|uniref:Uncharacterized protein n=1 Tax=Araneus ventricosus TaxID=182803 RepID=A0A4Y2JRV9_ARAVE|nr:hypothetical protein AVEN_273078-1 [Araneus ventricosus]GBM92674.1 hypothetical protein AVEN_136210-1 [Araneus ventricosus]